jgi:hypothetical protein
MMLEQKITDTRRLDWMIFYSGTIAHSSDGEFCWVKWYEDGEEMCGPLLGNARDAIDAAMEAQK